MNDNTGDKARMAMGGQFPKSEGRRFVEPDSGELEVTGPSRIYNQDLAAALLGRGPDKALEALQAIAEHTAAISKRLERWERDGMPGEQLHGYDVA
ncbi:hypothetical protein IM687_13805 [Stutzerimonas stutzeri]|uniref:hypothetical protein n=1 Tax=Stutzerimonas stutzeri TaxID=316 RepID=UPI0018AA61DF|nr:hypothetical protein [Stutzerimonas stutzeri]QPI08270.1 hypothetical protein IM687_13805 [Stutzerimonas stutzeri]